MSEPAAQAPQRHEPRHVGDERGRSDDAEPDDVRGRSDDVEQIRQLMYRYCELFDRGRIDEFVDLFARGTLTFRGLEPPCVGRDGVLDFIERRVIRYDGRPRTNHVISNAVIEVAPDRASASARSHITVWQATTGFALQAVMTGRYTDTYARDGAGWYFVTREAAGSLLGDMSHHLRPADVSGTASGATGASSATNGGTDSTVSTDLPAATETIAQGLIEAIESGDSAAITACCTDDVVIWHNYDDEELGLDGVLPMLATLAERVPGARYTDVRRRVIAGGYLQQHVLRGPAPSGELALPAVLVVEVRDGRIARIEEYLDRGALSVLRRPYR